MINTNKGSLWVVQTRTQQIQDGGRPPFWKIEKSPYLGNSLTDSHKICHGYAQWSSLPNRLLKSRTLYNSTWQTAAVFKTEKFAISW